MTDSKVGQDVARRSTEILPEGRVTRSRALAGRILAAGVSIPTPQLLYEASERAAGAAWFFPTTKEPDSDAVKAKSHLSMPHRYRGTRSTAAEMDQGHMGQNSKLSKARSGRRRRKRGSTRDKAASTAPLSVDTALSEAEAEASESGGSSSDAFLTAPEAEEDFYSDDGYYL